MGFVNQVVEPGKEIEAAKAWVASTDVTGAPWDEKGFKVPGGAGLTHPRAVQTQMVGTALLQKMTNHNYPAPLAIMSATYEGSVLPMDKALDVESKYFTQLLMDPTSRNMTRTLFLSKGEADKLVRRPEGPEKRPVTKLGILGAGMMGAGIAYVSAYAGMQVVLLDMSKDGAEKGKDYSRKLLQKRIDRGRMDADQAADILERITTTDSYDELAGCELVIEAVFEDVKIKADVTAKTEAVIPDDAIFASNTSTLPITGLAEASKRPEQFIGIHFFSPVDKMPLVEVIVGEKTGDVAIAQALDYIQQIRKTPIVVNDSRGFYTSRVFGTYSKEGIMMLAEGVNPGADRKRREARRHAGRPAGRHRRGQHRAQLPRAANDPEGTRRCLRCDRRRRCRHEVHRGTRSQGQEDRQGLLRLPRRRQETPLAGTRGTLSRCAEEQPSADEVRKRVLYVQAIDSVRCMEEGVVTHPADADIGSIFGWGFPPYAGGTISFIETVGLAKPSLRRPIAWPSATAPRFAVPDGLRAMAERTAKPSTAMPRRKPTAVGGLRTEFDERLRTPSDTPRTAPSRPSPSIARTR